MKEIENLIESAIPDFINRDNTLKLDDKIVIEIAKKLSENINSDMIIKALISEAISCFRNKLHDLMVKTDDVDHIIVLSDYSLLNQLDIKNITDKIESIMTLSNFDTIITGSSIASNIQDSVDFEFKTTGSVGYEPHNTFYSVGSIFDIPLYIDPYLKWRDTRMFFIESVKYNIGDIKIIEHDDHHFQPKVKLEVDIKLDFKNCKVLHVLENGSDEHKQFISENRNRKIDEITKYDF